MHFREFPDFFLIVNPDTIYLSVVAEIPWIIPVLELLPLGKDQVEIETLSYVLNSSLRRLISDRFCVIA